MADPKLTGVSQTGMFTATFFWDNGEQIAVTTNRTTVLFLMTLPYTDFKAKLSAR